jgi:hypothetical protein
VSRFCLDRERFIPAVFCPKLDAVPKVPYLHDHSVAKSQASRVVLGPKVKAGNIFWVVSRILSQTAVTLQKASITEDPPRPEVEDV